MKKISEMFKAKEHQGWGSREDRTTQPVFNASRFSIDTGPGAMVGAFSGSMGVGIARQRVAWVVFDRWTDRIVAQGTEISWRKAQNKANSVVRTCVENQLIPYMG